MVDGLLKLSLVSVVHPIVQRATGGRLFTSTDAVNTRQSDLLVLTQPFLAAVVRSLLDELQFPLDMLLLVSGQLRVLV